MSSINLSQISNGTAPVSLSSGLKVVSNPSVVLGGAGTSSTTQNQTLSAGNAAVQNNIFAVSTSTGSNMILTAGSPVVTIPAKGLYAIRLQLNLTNTSGGRVGVYVLGNNGIYYALTYTESNAGDSMWVQCTAIDIIPAGVTLTPYVYCANSGTINSADSTLSRFVVAQIWSTN